MSRPGLTLIDRLWQKIRVLCVKNQSMITTSLFRSKSGGQSPGQVIVELASNVSDTQNLASTGTPKINTDNDCACE